MKISFKVICAAAAGVVASVAGLATLSSNVQQLTHADLQVTNFKITAPQRWPRDTTHFYSTVYIDFRKSGLPRLTHCRTEILLPKGLPVPFRSKDEFDTGWFDQQGGSGQSVVFEQGSIELSASSAKEEGAPRARARVACVNYFTDWIEVDIPPVRD